MSAGLSPIVASLLAKAAADHGFDRELTSDEDWLAFASTLCPLRLWLGWRDDTYLAALSQAHVLRALDDHGVAMGVPAPDGAVGGRAVVDLPALHRLVGRALQLSRTLPDELLHTFEARVIGLPRATEAERLVIQRVGQDLFRSGLLELWEGRCAVTGLAVPELLRASHIKPWAACTSDRERLDVHNGLLLAPHLDAAFDRGYLTFADDGQQVVSRALDSTARAALGLDCPQRIHGLADGHRGYLPWHRERIFLT
jgi:putative restriction endonuclease